MNKSFIIFFSKINNPKHINIIHCGKPEIIKSELLTLSRALVS